jgi:hypothetical protein
MSSMISTLPSTRPTPFAPLGVRRITVDEYERIILAGAINDPESGGRVDCKPGQAVPVVIAGQALGHFEVDAILPSRPAGGNGA